VQTRGGPVGGGVGAPSVTWVLDETRVVGDNHRDRVSPVGWERGHVSVRRPSSTHAHRYRDHPPMPYWAAIKARHAGWRAPKRCPDRPARPRQAEAHRSAPGGPGPGGVGRRRHPAGVARLCGQPARCHPVSRGGGRAVPALRAPRRGGRGTDRGLRRRPELRRQPGPHRSRRAALRGLGAAVGSPRPARRAYQPLPDRRQRPVPRADGVRDPQGRAGRGTPCRGHPLPEPARQAGPGLRPQLARSGDDADPGQGPPASSPSSPPASPGATPASPGTTSKPTSPASCDPAGWTG
jgi:hypothetical protein